MSELLSTSKLSKRYGKKFALHDADIHIPQGEIYGLIGRNGAGKTTLLKLINSQITATSGEIHLKGQKMRFGVPTIRIGALVEFPSLYPHLTGRENLEVTRRLTGAAPAQIDHALAAVHLTDVADRVVRTYSTGRKQRLALALALLGDPKLLILDEPTNGLDPSGIREIRNLVSRFPEAYGITVFLSSHLLTEVEQVATHIGILQQGRLCFQGTLDALHAQMDNHAVLGVDQPERAERVLRGAGWTARRSGNGHLSVAINGTSDAAMVNAHLVRSGINVYQLHVERPTLEDIFLTLTGAIGVEAGAQHAV